MQKKRKTKRSAGDIAFNIVNYTFLMLLGITFVVPLYIVIMASFTPETVLIQNGYSFFPEQFSVDSYRFIFEGNNKVFSALLLSIATTVLGTVLSLLVSAMFAYALSRPKYPLKKLVMILLLFTMLFNGGLIPTYLVMRDLHLLNTFWILILMNLMAPWNVIILRNNFMSVPSSLQEAANLDGCGEIQSFFRIVLPLSKPALATIALFTAVGLWNDWTTPMWYITSTQSNLETLQLLLQRMMARIDSVLQQGGNFHGTQILPVESLKSAVVVVATVPIACIYPFLQKYFVKGTLIGAVKE